MGLILLILGVFYIVRRPKIARLVSTDYMNVLPQRFYEWKRNELLSIDIFLAATWGVGLLWMGALAAFMFLSPQTRPSAEAGAVRGVILFMAPLALFVVGLIASGIYGSKGARMRKELGIVLP